MKKSMIVLAAAALIPLTSVAQDSKTPPAKPTGAKEVVPGKALIQTIKLDEYVKNVGPDEIIEKMDSTGKGNPDIFVVFKKNENGSRQLIMQSFDLNRDKKIDLVKKFEKGKMVRTEMDLDYDGMVDVVSEYDVANGELKKKIQADGATNIWKYYFQNELRKKEVDRNSDGRPDMWVYFRNGKVLRTEIDQNFDGRIVRVEGALSPNKGKKTATGATVPTEP